MPDPTFHAPTNVKEALELLHVVGPQVKVAVNALLEFDTNEERVAIVKRRAAPLIDTGGYIIEESYGLPEGDIGAGGGPKPPLTASDTSFPGGPLPPP